MTLESASSSADQQQQAGVGARDRDVEAIDSDIFRPPIPPGVSERIRTGVQFPAEPMQQEDVGSAPAVGQQHWLGKCRRQ